MSRFTNDMDYEKRDIVELQSHMDMEELFHQDSKVDKQMKRKNFQKNKLNSIYNTSNWMMDKSKKEGSSTSLKVKISFNSNKSTSTSFTNSINCFKCLGMGYIASQCPNKRALVIKGWINDDRK